MKIKKKTCNKCTEEKVIWKNYEGEKYCQYCWNTIKAALDEGKPVKLRAPIKPKSAKQAKLDSLYTQLRKPWMENNPMCEANLVGCTHHSTDVHHKKGRGKWLLIVDTWMSVCRTCHTWIETHPVEATEMGYRESKITE